MACHHSASPSPSPCSSSSKPGFVPMWLFAGQRDDKKHTSMQACVQLNHKHVQERCQLTELVRSLIFTQQLHDFLSNSAKARSLHGGLFGSSPPPSPPVLLLAPAPPAAAFVLSNALASSSATVWHTTCMQSQSRNLQFQEEPPCKEAYLLSFLKYNQYEAGDC